MPPEGAEPAGGLGAMGTGRFGVPPSLPGVLLEEEEEEGEKSWRRAELGDEASCSRRKEAMGEAASPGHMVEEEQNEHLLLCGIEN